MGFLSEFKVFVVKGNVVDMVVGIIIGVVFGKIVLFFVGDVIMLLIGLLIGGVDFFDLVIMLKVVEGDVLVVVLVYGKFIQIVFDFVIVVFVIFMGVKVINCFKCEEVVVLFELLVLSVEEILLIEICDLLKVQQNKL